MSTIKQISYYESMVAKSVEFSLAVAILEEKAFSRENLEYHANLANENFKSLSVMDASNRIQARSAKLAKLEMQFTLMLAAAESKKAADSKKTAEAVEVKVSAQDKPKLPEGMYQMNGSIYKVQKAIYESGYMYAKKLTEVKDGKWKFLYAQGVIAQLRLEHKLSAEQAKEFGQVTGVCCICGRTLTDETSIAEGIGPICKKKF